MNKVAVFSHAALWSVWTQSAATAGYIHDCFSMIVKHFHNFVKGSLI